MAEQRTIELLLDAVQQTVMQNATDYKEWCAAIGKLSSWNMSYPKVKIFADGETDMTAVYYDHEDQRKYVIGAVWHEDHYGFHS